MGNSLSIGSATASTGEGGLRVDKAKTEAKLADWVHCVSAKSPEGKAKILDLSNELRTIDAKIEKVDRDKPVASASLAPRSSPTDTLGNVVDVYA